MRRLETLRASVVVATYQRPQLLSRLLRQLAAQQLPPKSFEVVVVDDGSSQPVEPLLKLETFPFELRVLRQSNAGAASARDAGARAAGGDVLIFLDDDMQVGPSFVARHLAAHSEGPDRVVLGRLRGDPRLSSLPLFERWHQTLLDRKADAMSRGPATPDGASFFSGNVSLRKASYASTGGFDRALPQSEDLELGFQLQRQGARFVFCSEAESFHGSDHASWSKWLARALSYGRCDWQVGARHPENPAAQPLNRIRSLHRLTRPFARAALIAPFLTAPLPRLFTVFARIADRLKLSSAAHATTSLAYNIQYFRGVAGEAGGLPALVLSREAQAKRLRFGNLPVDLVDLTSAVERIAALVSGGRGGVVFTPNVDHVVTADRRVSLRDAYRVADLSVADGMPLVWASRLFGRPLRERVAGSDLFWPLMAEAKARGWGVYLLGGAEGAAAEAAARLSAQGIRIVGAEGPRIGLEVPAPDEAEVLARIAAAAPELLVVGLGAPKQELFIARNREALGGAVALGLGATIDFAAGRVPRAPRWMASSGLEWLYRLSREPKRLWRRYLVEDPRFVRIIARQWGRQLAGALGY